MAIAVFIDHQKLTLAAFDEVDRRVHAAIADSGPAGLVHHSLYGKDGALMTFEVWESEEDFEAFGSLLMPILAELGVELRPPRVWPLQRLSPVSAKWEG